MPLVIFFASPPEIGTVYRSPIRSKIKVWPFGETSSDSQVPSSVVNSILRSGFRGRGASFLASVFAGSAGAAFLLAGKAGVATQKAKINATRYRLEANSFIRDSIWGKPGMVLR